MSRLLARLGSVFATGLALLLGFAPAAVAHVTVHSSDAVHGGTAEISFRVPSESDTARTVKLQIQFPGATPLAKVHVLPHPGWNYRVTRSSLPTPMDAGHGDQVSEVVGQIEWTAAAPDAGIKPGEYDVFRVSAGPVPKTDRIVFKVVQTYDDGQVSRWIDEPASGSEPEHPAAVLAVSSTSDTSAVANMGHAMPMASSASASSSNGAPLIAWLALGITGVAVVAALWAVLISMRAARRRGGDEAAA